jgi:hypothetical protein
MPKLRRNLPAALFRHLTQRAIDREITVEQLRGVSEWIDNDPDVPEERWFKRLPGVIVCGEGDLIKTFLRPGQVPSGREMR